MSFHRIASALLMLSALATSGATLAPPPVAPVELVTEERFGTTLLDPYRWMEQGGARLTTWLQGQADHTRRVLDASGGREALRKRIAALDDRPSLVPQIYVAGDSVFYRRGPSLYVRPARGGAERTLVDGIARGFARDGVRMTLFRPSGDGAYVGFATIRAGVESGTVQFVDVRSGRDLPDVVEQADTLFRQAWWIGANRFVYYREKVGNVLTDSVPMIHTLGSRNDVPVFAGNEPFDLKSSLVIAARFTVAITPNGYYLADTARLGSPAVRWQRIVAADGHTGYVNADDRRVYLIATQPRFAVRTIDARDPGHAAATTLFETADAALSMAFAGDAIYVALSNGATSRLGRLAFDGTYTSVELPYDANIANLTADVRASGAAVMLSAWTRPSAWFRYAPAKHAFAELGIAQRAVPGYERVVADEVTVASADGTQIPLSILHARTMRANAPHPALLEVYGAFGIARSPAYDPAILPWIEHDGIVAVAHVRGGGELGEAWSKAATKTLKHRTVDDFLACARYLVASGVTAPARLVGEGASAGGIPIGVATVSHPELFAAMIDSVPVSDLIRSPLADANADEFGSPKKPDEFGELYAMSAYYHVRPGTRYPAVLLETGINDARVPPWDVAKMAARLEAATSSGRPVLLRVDFAAGHGSASREAAGDVLADEYAFALWQSGDPAFAPM